jgi:hypothetical protein
MNLVQLIFVGLLTYSTIKLNYNPFKVLLVLTGLIIFGKFICQINFLTAEKEV